MIITMLSCYYIIGTAYQQLSQYKCTLAVETLHKLPPSQFSTGWVQHQVCKLILHIITHHYIGCFTLAVYRRDVNSASTTIGH
jgi:hypothetical protein